MRLLFICLITLQSSVSFAQQKHAVLVGVSKYQHSKLNETQLLFPEADAKAVGELLDQAGYDVSILTGRDATQKAIKDALASASRTGESDGVLILGFFGHGVQYGDTAYYCPYDSALRTVTDDDGKVIRDKSGLSLKEPDPDSLISMLEMLDAMDSCPAGNKMLLADCCRNDPSRARGFRSRAFGSTLRVDQLPNNCAAIFACSKGEQALEHDDWGHGALTQALLLECKDANGMTANSLFPLLYSRVNELVREKSGDQEKQTVSSLHAGWWI